MRGVPRARVACKCWHMLLLVQQTQLHRILHVRLLATKILRHFLKYLLNIWKLNVFNLEITELTLIGQEHFTGVDKCQEPPSDPSGILKCVT